MRKVVNKGSLVDKLIGRKSIGKKNYAEKKVGMRLS